MEVCNFPPYTGILRETSLKNLATQLNRRESEDTPV